jgi:hypothetical protein
MVRKLIMHCIHHLITPSFAYIQYGRQYDCIGHLCHIAWTICSLLSMLKNPIRAVLILSADLVMAAIVNFKMPDVEIVFAYISVCETHIDFILLSLPYVQGQGIH